MESLILSLLVVAAAEFGDKTQLLVIMLAARYRCPTALIAGVLVATLANHGAAAVIGAWASGFLSGQWFQAGVGLSFLAMAPWLLKADDPVDETALPSRFGPFLTTLVTFFLAEIGDKTQVATVALAARFNDPLTVTIGTTAGLLLVNLPAIFLGNKLAEIVPLVWVRRVAAFLFMAMGLATLVDALGWI